MRDHIFLWKQTVVDKICLICQGREERKVILKSKEHAKNRPKVKSSRQQAENQDKTFSAHAQLLLHLLLNNFYLHIMSQSRQQCHLSTIVSVYGSFICEKSVYLYSLGKVPNWIKFAPKSGKCVSKSLVMFLTYTNHLGGNFVCKHKTVKFDVLE